MASDFQRLTASFSAPQVFLGNFNSEEVQRGFQRNAIRRQCGQEFFALNYDRLARHRQRGRRAIPLALRPSVFSALRREAI